jgi:hypothetical protein
MLEDPVTAAEVLPTLGGINCLYVLQDMLDAGIRWVGDWVSPGTPAKNILNTIVCFHNQLSYHL